MQYEARQVGRGEQQVGAERHVSLTDADGAAHAVAGGHLASFVELPVGRQVRLRHDTQHLAAVDHHGGVVDPVLIAQRRADHEHGHQFGGRDHDVEQRDLDRVEQGVLQQDVLDRIAGQRQLRKNSERDAVVVAVPGQPQYRLGVGGGVGEGRVMGARSHPHEPVPVCAVEVHHPLLSPVKGQDPVTGWQLLPIVSGSE